MDSFTHIFLGGCLGQLAAGRKAGRKAVLWGAIADTVPDLDVFSVFFVHPVDALLIHRGLTHSVSFAIVFSLLGGILLARYYKTDHMPWRSWSLILALGSFSHLLIDTLTNYGTGLLEPFSGQRFSFTTIFIADLAFTFPMMIAFLVLLFKKPSETLKHNLARYALFSSSLYAGCTIVNKFYFESYFKKQFKDQHIIIQAQRVAPSPLNNILWGTMGKTDSGYYSGYHSLFSKKDTVEFTFIPKNETMAAAFQGQPEFEKLCRFTQGYYCISVDKSGRLSFNDLRDGMMNGWNKSVVKYTFSYPLVRGAGDTAHLIKANPWPKDGLEGMGSLWNEMWGKRNQSSLINSFLTCYSSTLNFFFSDLYPRSLNFFIQSCHEIFYSFSINKFICRFTCPGDALRLAYRPELIPP